MPLEFTNVIKGQVTQTLLTALLERGGYRVTRLGIEELFGEVKYINLDQYLRLKLPLQLRYLPDLLIAEFDMSNAFLVEVKYRRSFTDESARVVRDELAKQHEFWPQAYAVIMVSQPFKPDASFHQDYIRVVGPDDLDILVDQSRSPNGSITCFLQVRLPSCESGPGVCWTLPPADENPDRKKNGRSPRYEFGVGFGLVTSFSDPW